MHRGKVDPGGNELSQDHVNRAEAFVNFITLITLRWFGQFILSRQLFFTIKLIAFHSYQIQSALDLNYGIPRLGSS